MGACFYHPRETHVSLGIMSVRPNYSGKGEGRLMVDHILDFAGQNDYKACRLVSSALNLNLFSLYNRAGCVPQGAYQDMVMDVPENGLDVSVPGEDFSRAATFDDVYRMGELEMEIRGISALFVTPMQKRVLVEQLYEWKAFSVETQLKEVWGEFQEYNGVSIPSYLPETELIV